VGHVYYIICSPESVLLDGLDPRDVAVASDGTAVVATNSMLVLIRDNKRVSDLAVSYDPMSADMHPTKPEVAIGGKVSIAWWVHGSEHLTFYILQVGICNSDVISVGTSSFMYWQS